MRQKSVETGKISTPLVCALLAVLIGLPYIGCLAGTFSWIEPGEILTGQLIVDSWGEFWSMLTANDSNFAGYHRPVYNLVLSADWYLWGENPVGHHATTLFFHIANALLVFLCFKRLFQKIWPAIAIAGAWALLPVHTAVVPMIVGKSDVVPFFFTGLTLLTLLAARDTPVCRKFFLVSSAVFFTLGIFTKESVIVLPAMLGFFLFVGPSRLDFSKSTLRSRFALVTIFGTIGCAYVLFRWSIGSFVSTDTQWSFTDRMLSMLPVYADYFTRSLTAIELTKNDAVFLWSEHPNFGGVILTVAVLVFIQVMACWKVPDARAGIFWFHVFLLPAAQIIPILHFRADRFLYLPSLGIVWAAVCCTQKLLGDRTIPIAPRTAFIGAASLLVPACIYRVYHRVPDLKNDITHYGPLVEKYPYCREGQAFLAQAYMNNGNWEKARTAFTHALTEHHHIHSYVHRPSLYGSYARFLIGRRRYSEAYEILRINARSYYEENTINDFYLGVCCKNISRPTEAKDYFLAHLQNNPSDPSGTYLLGETYVDLADIPAAIITFERYLQLVPNAQDAPHVREFLTRLRNAN